MEYQATWQINVDAETPVDAAKTALEIQRDPTSTATVFTVVSDTGKSTEVDLQELGEVPVLIDYVGILKRAFDLVREGKKDIGWLEDAAKVIYQLDPTLPGRD